MRILLSDRYLSGHRRVYMQWLAATPGVECFCLATENVGVDAEHFIPLNTAGNSSDRKSLLSYLHWIAAMRAAVREKGIDVVHILDGDSIMRFFGLGFGLLGVRKRVMTFHHFFPGFLQTVSYRMMCGRTGTCVVHTESVRASMRGAGLKSPQLCAYPSFGYCRIASRDPAESKRQFGLPTDIPVIGIVGAMNAYKNILPFLDTMASCQQPFHLLICGSESDITREEILRAIQPYADKVTMLLRFLSEEEYEQAICASDLIFSLYSHEFDGASGPLTDGVCAGKMILSCRHGSLGQIVSQHHLGLTAESSSKADMLRQTELALAQAQSFHYDETAQNYRHSLNPAAFQERYRAIYCGKQT